MANRTCRVYISTDKPSIGLKLLVKYIIQVYVPVSLAIKRNPSCLMGARHFHTLIQLSRFLTTETAVPKAVMNKFDRCLHRNGFFAHPENILLAMCDDERQPIRTLAYTRILNARIALRDQPPGDIREYIIPALQFNSPDYVDMIKWQQISPEHQTPPLLRDLLITDENIQLLAVFRISDPNFKGTIKNANHEEIKFNLDLANIPCHSQAVERCVKTVTEASKHVSSESLREGYIIAKLCHRAQMPSFSTKKEFAMHDEEVEPKL